MADVGLGRYVLYFALYMTSVEFFVYWQHRILHMGVGYRCGDGMLHWPGALLNSWLAGAGLVPCSRRACVRCFRYEQVCPAAISQLPTA